MHYRPIPKGYKPMPFISTKVKVSTIVNNINSGKYEVQVLFTDTNHIANAPIVRRVNGEEAIQMALQFLIEWANYEGKVEKCGLPTKRGVLHKEFMVYRNLYTKLNDNRHVFVALIKK